MRHESDLELIRSIVPADLAKRLKSPTRSQQRLTDAAALIKAAPDAAERAFMARQLILCTLPYRDPGNVPRWTRRTGNSSLMLLPGWDEKSGKSFGYPYGTIPRLLLLWVITEAARTKSRRLILGRNLSKFARALGLNGDSGGKRGSAKRLQDQIMRLFRCHIDLDHKNAAGEYSADMTVTRERWFAWGPKPEQDGLWESWIELSESFYNNAIAAPVPLDLRALRALKRSPLALDLYSLISYRAYVIVQNNRGAEFLSWKQLRCQLGIDIADIKDFKKKGLAALLKIALLYPGLTIKPAPGGFTIHATRLAVPEKIVESKID